jgi:hypothetical protein
MATKFMRIPTRSLAILAAISSLFLGLIVPTSAEALVLVRPATQWGHVYAGPATNATQSPAPKVGKLEKKSKFIVKYNNFPEWTKTQAQAAIDVWAANFESSVPIYIEATWGRSSSYSVLGSARPGSYFANFKGAPDASLW